MNSYFIYNPKEVDAVACQNEAARRYHSSGEKSAMHYHKTGDPCNSNCQLYPPNEPPKDAN